MVLCGVLGIFEQQKIYVALPASFGAEIFYCKALGVGFEREDVDAYCRILFFEERDLFGFHWVIYSTHVECGFVFNTLAHAFFVVFRFV